MFMNVFSFLCLINCLSNPFIDNLKILETNEYSNEFLQKFAKKLDHTPSMQSYKGETLNFKEYEFIRRTYCLKLDTKYNYNFYQFNLLNYKKIKRAQKLIERLEQNYNCFIENNRNYLLQKDSIIKAVKSNQANYDQISFILVCKKWMMDVASQEGTWFDLNSLKKHWRLEEIKNIEELADLQNLQLDQAIYASLLDEHIRCQPIGQQPLRIVIEGAGPNGLYAALNLFKAGANVIIINDRGEQYIRNQIIALDPIWMAQLRYFLGTKFNELFKGEAALGSIDYTWKNGEINTKYLEDVLKQRLVELSSYIENYADSTNHLKLLFETNITGLQPLQESNKGFRIQLEALQNISNSSRIFEQNIFDNKLTNFLEEIYRQEGSNFDLNNNKDKFQLTLMERLKDWEAENTSYQLIRKQKPFITCDMLICCGGIRDEIRDDYLCPSFPLTIPKNYGVACWNKKRKSQSKKFLNEKDHYTIVTADEIASYLKEQNLDDLLFQEKYLPQSLHRKYANFTQKILNDIKNAPVQLRLFENQSTFYCGAETPNTLNLFIQEIVHIKSLLSKQQDSFPKLKQYIQYYDLLRMNLEKKWFSAIAAIFGVNDKQVSFDISPLNTGTFDVIQQSIQIPAKILGNDQNSVMIVALGDSLASPHFFSGSGMSSGRLAGQYIAKHVKTYHQGLFNNKQALVNSLNHKLDKVKIKVVEKGSSYVKRLSFEDSMKFLKDKMKNKIQQQATLTKNKFSNDLGYKVVLDENFFLTSGLFYLYYLDIQGNEKMESIEINFFGELISHSLNIKASTFYELLFSLR